MRRLRPLVLLVLVGSPLAAQSSQFGVRGLGLPMRPISVRATGTGGAFGLFDSESALNPAAIGLSTYLNASFQTVQGWRHSESPAGSASAQDNRFPGIFVSGPIGGTRLALALSASGFTDRNYELASSDTLILRGVPVETFDTLTSHGGISDLRVALAWRQDKAIQWGLGLHLLTGSNRVDSRRRFSDTTYAAASERLTISYLGYGVSAGVVARLGQRVTLGGMVRADNHLRVERDSLAVGTTRLPLTVSGGFRVQMGQRLLVAGSGLFRNWSVSDGDLVAQGGVGSTNTTEFNGGIEYLTDPKHPFRHPIRLGVYHARLPFPLRKGEDADENGISIGSSFRFVADRAGIDVALQHVWRKGGTGFSEQATLLNFGVSIRP